MPTSTIILGTLSIHNSTARALTDTDSTHSFVSYKFGRNLTVKPEPLRIILNCRDTIYGLLEAHVVYRAYKVKVLRRELAINLILLDFFSSDIILGMDWLEAYCAIIDCYDKTIILHSPKKKQS